MTPAPTRFPRTTTGDLTAPTSSAASSPARRDLLLELGGDQADLVKVQMDELGYADIEVWVDEDGDVRGVEATRLSI
jgi:hypothetical protein